LICEQDVELTVYYSPQRDPEWLRCIRFRDATAVTNDVQDRVEDIAALASRALLLTNDDTGAALRLSKLESPAIALGIDMSRLNRLPRS
jgi:hypothetical protein